jgi:ribonuclease P protein component
VLPPAARLTSRQDFTRTVRAGRRAGRGTLVVHLLPAAHPPAEQARVGFVVGRAVDGSVRRHRVARRLRHLVRDRLSRLPAGALVVVRALPAARDASSATLGQDLDVALARLRGASPPPGPPPGRAHRTGSEAPTGPTAGPASSPAARP